MKRALFAMIALLVCVAAAEPPEEATTPWSHASLEQLRRWVAMAPSDALPILSTKPLDKAIANTDEVAIDREASALALKLARMHLLGQARAAERVGWNIEDTDKAIDLDRLLALALSDSTLDTFFASLRPRHTDYGVLRAAYARETDPGTRQTIARNMERWRWMPRSLGEDYVLVNPPQFEARLWRNGRRESTWKVIVGKKTTPTPVFGAVVSGVILNPWWEIPASIVRESIGGLVRRNPSAARARGYVWSGGRYRQRPGPNNALGQMKLVMPNRFHVYMHDTPNKQLFDEEVRAFSHGCIRTNDAIGYAATLLQGIKTRSEIDAIVASVKTTRIDLAKPIPIYVAYFTAAVNDDGTLAIQPDIYNRDSRIKTARVQAAPAAGAELALLPNAIGCTSAG